MFNADLLRLMQRIALGLPLALPTLAAPFNYAGCYPLGYTCPEDHVATTVEYTTEGEGSVVDCAAACGHGHVDCRAVDESHVECIHAIVQCPAAGRRPVGEVHRASSGVVREPVAQWLFDALTLEASAVPAFDELRTALERHGAPAELSARAGVARDDELRHTEAMARLLARREQRVRVRVRVGATEPQSLYALALANVTEGCTREAFGALEAAMQAERANDPDVRAEMAIVARDEARHALLAFDIDRWARTRLDVESVAELDEARRVTIRGLRDSLCQRDVPAGLGLITNAEALALV